MIRFNSLLCCILLALFNSCGSGQIKKDAGGPPEKLISVKVHLIDSLGEIRLSMPARFDTSFSWVQLSDCGKPCEQRKYRFQPKALPILKESGWINRIELKDSVENLTISHSGYFPFYNGDTAKNIVRHDHIRKELISGFEGIKIVFDTIQKIDDRYYSIFAMKADTIQLRRVLAVTTIRGNLIRFQYELLTKKNDSSVSKFIKNSIDLLQTIHISNGL